MPDRTHSSHQIGQPATASSASHADSTNPSSTRAQGQTPGIQHYMFTAIYVL